MACRKKTTILRMCKEPQNLFPTFFSSFTLSHFLVHRADNTNMPLNFNKNFCLECTSPPSHDPWTQLQNPALKSFSLENLPQPSNVEVSWLLSNSTLVAQTYFYPSTFTFPREYLLMCLPSNPVFEGCTSLYLWCLGNGRHGWIHKIRLPLMEILRKDV